MSKTKIERPRRVRRARPLLIALGAVLLASGCGDDTTGLVPNNDASALVDMGIPANPKDMKEVD